MYPVTATLSLEAVQLKAILVAVRVVDVNPEGTVGADVSAMVYVPPVVVPNVSVLLVASAIPDPAAKVIGVDPIPIAVNVTLATTCDPVCGVDDAFATEIEPLPPVD